MRAIDMELDNNNILVRIATKASSFLVVFLGQTPLMLTSLTSMPILESCQLNKIHVRGWGTRII